MGWLIALAVITGLAILPLGASVLYTESGVGVWLVVGTVRIRLYPAKKKKSGDSQKEKKKKEPKPEPESAAHKKARKKAAAMAGEESGGSWKKFLPLVRIGLDFLGELRRKIRVRRLELKLTMAGDDPCDLAVNYGRANASMGTLLAALDRAFVIQKQQVDIRCDFAAEEMTVYARLDVTLTLGRATALAVRYGVRGLKAYLNLSKIRKGGASL